MNHKNKKRLARRLMSKEDIKDHKPPFETDSWKERHAGIAYGVFYSEAKTQIRVKKKQSAKNEQVYAKYGKGGDK